MDVVRHTLLDRFVTVTFDYRRIFVAVLAVLTLALGWFAWQVEIRTVFADLLPQKHPYVTVHERFKETFGGSNVVSIMVEVEQGDVFTRPALAKVQAITNALSYVDGVNTTQIISLATRKLREIRSSTAGIDSRPLMHPDLPANDQELEALRAAVLKNPLVYGSYVSFDLKAALVTVDFYDQKIEYSKVFAQIREIADKYSGDGATVRVVGDPVLYGWVAHYVPETLHILLATIGALVSLLFVVARTIRGTLLPLLAGFTSAVWALGAARLLGFHMDPLVIVVAFLITARSISHAVQVVTCFDNAVADGRTTMLEAAKHSMHTLLKPGLLGVFADAGAMLVVILTPIPLMQKISLIGTIWVLTIGVTASVTTPLLLTWVRKPHAKAHAFDLSPYLERVLKLCVGVAIGRARFWMLGLTAIVFVASGLYAFNLKVGDANPGSPILWPNSPYNTDAAAINGRFSGADRMFVVVAGKAPDAIKEPGVLTNMQRFQRFMEAQPEVGATLSLADILPPVRALLREGNLRYLELGRNAEENGELLFMLKANADAGDLDRFVDPTFQDGAVTLFFRDHQGETIQTAVARIKEFMAANPLDHAEYLLAGGLAGVLAAVNEVILAGQIESIALALLVLVICCGIAYRSMSAGLFFMVPVVLSNTLTFSYMAWKGIGMNVNTLPVAALGIGLGVDYAIYVVDGIREELENTNDLGEAIRRSLLLGPGKGVLVTALTPITSVGLWWLSSLRFQAEMGVLMAIWLCISAFSALFIMPAVVYVFRPEFVVGRSAERNPAPALAGI